MSQRLEDGPFFSAALRFSSCVEVDTSAHSNEKFNSFYFFVSFFKKKCVILGEGSFS